VTTAGYAQSSARPRSALLDASAQLGGATRTWWSANRHRMREVRLAVLGFLFDVAGFGLLSAAAWVIAMPAGLAVAGVCFLVLGWSYTDRGRTLQRERGGSRA
jgi:hypothetical protein